MNYGGSISTIIVLNSARWHGSWMKLLLTLGMVML
jgi:hypothetical protein